MKRPDTLEGFEGEHAFAPILRTIGKGPGRSRGLSQPEARWAMGEVLAGRVDPMQLGAFLLLLRYRKESAEELAGLMQGITDNLDVPEGVQAPALNWPSYAAGRSRGAPWYLLAALLVAQMGHSVFMHGFNSHLQGGATALDALAGIGLSPANNLAQASDQIAASGFSYLALEDMHPELQTLLSLRPVLGLRTGINTVLRLLNPLGAPASFLGVFHPGYIDTHLGSALLLGETRAGVVKGGGGEAERNPLKPSKLHIIAGEMRADIVCPPLLGEGRGAKPPKASLDQLVAVWRGEAEDEIAHATIIGTAAQALLVIGAATDHDEALALAGGAWGQR